MPAPRLRQNGPFFRNLGAAHTDNTRDFSLDSYCLKVMKLGHTMMRGEQGDQGWVSKVMSGDQRGSHYQMVTRRV